MKHGLLLTAVILVTSNFILANGKVNIYDQRKQSIEAITKNHDKVIIDFYANWCGPCKRMMPNLEKIAKEHPEIYVVKVNSEDYRDLTQQYGISSLPTLLFFKNETTIRREIGSKTFKDLTTFIKKHLD